MKFLFGVFIGATAGTLVLVGTIAGFFTGLMLGWHLFSSDDDEPSTETPDKVEYRGPSTVKSSPEVPAA